MPPSIYPSSLLTSGLLLLASASTSASATKFPSPRGLTACIVGSTIRGGGARSATICGAHSPVKIRDRLNVRGGGGSPSGYDDRYGEEYYGKPEDYYGSSYQDQGPDTDRREDSYYNDFGTSSERRDDDYFGDYGGHDGKRDYVEDDGRYQENDFYGDYNEKGGRRQKNAPRQKSSIASSVPLPKVLKGGNKKVGLIMLGSGAMFTFLGVALFFNKNLMRLGNLLFIGGIPMTIGPSRTIGYFMDPSKARATGCLALGMFLVFIGWPIIGIGLEIFGLLNLFGNMFPLAMMLLRNVPGLGNLFPSSRDKRKAPLAKNRNDRNEDDYRYEDDLQQSY